MKLALPSSRFLFWSGLLLTFLTGIFNLGIIAVDDYTYGVQRIIPAQDTSFAFTIADRDFRFPFPALVLMWIGKLALFFGLETPTAQYRFALGLIGIITFLIQARSALGHFQTIKNEKDTLSRVVLFLIGFYFLSALLYSRPLIENLSSPWLTLGCFLATIYWTTGKRLPLVGAVAAISLSALFRYQTGVCFLALGLVVLLKKDLRGFLFVGMSGLVFFILTGCIDWALTGSFHGSLIAYTQYNLDHSSGYGTLPFYTFFALLLGLSLPPTFLSRYGGLNWNGRYQALTPALIFFFIFLISHSLVPHKEERFIAPILPVFLILLTPLLHYFIYERPSTPRLAWFFGLNTILLVLTVTSSPQRNTISLVRYLDTHTEVERIQVVADSFAFYPQAFSRRKVPHEVLALSSLGNLGKTSCNTRIAARADYQEALQAEAPSLVKTAEFRPGPLEALLVKLNPRANRRRGAITLYQAADCGKKETKSDS